MALKKLKKPTCVELLIIIHQKLIKTTGQVQDFFGPVFVSGFIFTATATTVHLYFIYFYVTSMLKHDEDFLLIHRLSVSINVVIFHVILLLGICTICQNITNTSENVNKLMIKAYFKDCKEGSRLEMSETLGELIGNTRAVQISACGFFTINLGTVSSVSLP